MTSPVASKPSAATKPPVVTTTQPPDPELATTTITSTPNLVPRNTSAPQTSAAGPTPTATTVLETEPVVGTTPSPASPSVSPAGQVAEVHQAEELQAPQQDVELAKAAIPVEQRPDPAPQADVDTLRNALQLSSANEDWRERDGRGDDYDWDRTVRQWDRDWVRYDDYYRPILFNPYRQVVQVVYVYQYQPRIVFIPPLASIVLSAIEYGAYNFTALLLDPVGTALNIAVGSFFGGGYYPGPYLAPPPPPPPLITYDQVPVVVNYREATYEPFLVRQVVDVGDDVRYGERRVLLDGVTPVWGVWRQTPDGQRLFEVHKTQRFPGLVDPQEGPLPGDYQLRLASTEPPGFTARDVYVIASAAAVMTLAVSWAALALLRRRGQSLH